MQDAGEKLNLQPHIVRCVDGVEREVYAAADIEVRRGGEEREREREREGGYGEGVEEGLGKG